MPQFTFAWIALCLFAASLLAVLGFSVGTHPGSRLTIASPTNRFGSCVVKVIYDGDTFGCDLNGDHHIDNSEEHIRMLGIDATEMHYSKKNHTGMDQPYALEAKTRVEKAILYKRIYLEYDRQRFDHYDRTLAYVYQDPLRTRMLNEDLLSEGLAKVLFMGSNRRYERQFTAIEDKAKANHLKLWR